MSVAESITAWRACTSCQESYPATPEFFFRSKTGRHGVQSYCKACTARPEHRQRWRLKLMALRDGLKFCSSCETGKPPTVGFFHEHPGTYDGLSPTCRACKREYDAAHYRNNREVKITAVAHYRSENRTACLARAAAYRERNRDVIRRSIREHYRLNRESYFARARGRRARKADAPGSHTSDELWTMYEDQQGLCCYCDKPMFGDWHEEHLTPLSRGGSDGPENIALSCSNCNLRKGRRTLMEFLSVLGYEVVIADG